MTASEAEIRALYQSGRYFSAYRAARAAGYLDVDRATPPAHATLAARITGQAGARRRARKILLESWRRHRTHSEAALFYGFELASESSLAALDFMDRIAADTVRTWSAEERGAWLLLRASELADLRDFRGAERVWDAALGVFEEAWTWVVRSKIDRLQDRDDRALEAARRARALNAWYRPAVEAEAHLLCRLRRTAEARALLEDAVTRLEAASVVFTLYTRQREDRDYDAALRSLDVVARYSPEMERAHHDALAVCFAQIHYLRGDRARSRACLRLALDEELRGRADDAREDGARVELPVPHVPQHHNTCAPATLTAIAEFWKEPVDHVEIAETICHDGTPAASERRWCAERGFAVREFTVTWEALTAVLDRGLPFHLTTHYSASAHAQAVVGYDSRRRSILIMNPSALSREEYDWDALLERQAAFGPRGLLFVPAAEAHRLDGLELPDAELHDLLHVVNDSLQRHDRAAAAAALATLTEIAPTHLLRYRARLGLAEYDDDSGGVLEWAEATLIEHPGHPRLLLAKLSASRGLATRASRAEIAEELLRDHGTDPAVLARCASFFAEDGDGGARSALLSWRAIRTGYSDANAYRVLADHLWEHGDRIRATRLYRIASCLAEGDERVAWSYFLAARAIGRPDEAFEHLEDRLARMSGRSAAPAGTLSEAYRSVGRAAEALAPLRRALERHPDDGEILLALAEERRLAGAVDEAAELLARAEGKVHPTEWWRHAATLAMQRGHRDEALALWKRIADANPTDAGAQAVYVQHLEDAGQGAVAREHLRDLVARYPHRLPLAELLHDYLEDRDPAAARALLDELAVAHPGNAWVALERARTLAVASDPATRDAIAHARAVGCEPSALLHLEGYVAQGEGRRDDARTAYRAALELDLDSSNSISSLIGLARNADEVRADLDFVWSRLQTSGAHGNSFLAYASAVREHLDAPSALERLRALRQLRGHLPDVWAAEIDFLARHGRLDEALALAREAVGRFDRSAPLWRDLALVHDRRGETAERIAALERALERAPTWMACVRLLAAAVAEHGDVERAEALLDRTIAAEPWNGSNYGFLAEIRRDAGRTAEAVDLLERALSLLPEYPWAWDRLGEWTAGSDRLVTVARAVIAAAPRAIRARLVVAQRDRGASLDERLALLREVSAIVPDDTDVDDLAAELLAGAGRWDEALAACRPPFWGDAPPTRLLGRAAWVLHERGDHAGARTAMLRAIASTPSYDWGINRLMEWTDEHDSAAMALQIVRTAPRSAVAHAHLGETYRLAGRIQEAEHALNTALSLDRSCLLARLGMFDVYYARSDFASAATCLRDLDEDNPWVLARTVQVSAATGRRDEADAAWERLHALPNVPEETVREAVTGYRSSGLAMHLDKLLHDAVFEADATAEIGRVWWNHVAWREPASWGWKWIRRMPDSPARRFCEERLVQTYPDRCSWWEFAQFFFTHRKRLAARPELWGSTTFVLRRYGFLRLCRRWARDWVKRDGVRPWMLLALARASFLLGKLSEGWHLCRAALQLPDDHTSNKLRLLLAPADALEGAPLPATAADEMEDQFLARLASTIAAHRRSATPPRGGELVASLRHVIDAVPGAQFDALCRKMLRGVVAALAREKGSGIRWHHRVAIWIRTV